MSATAMEARLVTVDVRETIRNGGDPFSKIMSAVESLQIDEELLVVAPFQPLPLLALLEKQGFQHAVRTTASGDWEVRFWRASGPGPVKPAAPAISSDEPVGAFPAPTEWVEVDARGLEPPQPLIRILEAVAGLPAGVGLRAHTDRRPIHLYAQLAERSFAAETEEQPDGSFITHIGPRH